MTSIAKDRKTVYSVPWILALFLLASASGLAAQRGRDPGPSWDFRHGDLKVSENRRYLVHADGTPFFYLGDTAWELFHRLNREETERYLENRRRKRFTVIQAVVLAELDGLNTPNAYGERPLHDNDPTRPNEAYFQHVDWVVDRATEKGLYIGMLPTWGDKVVLERWGKGPIVFTPSNARTYGRFLAARYKDRPNIIWILGGDRNGEGYEEVWRAMAAGLREGDGGRHLITYHPRGQHSSSEWFHEDAWLDFNMLQSGHGHGSFANWKRIQADYERTPVKPCMDGEPAYEDIPVAFEPKKGWVEAPEVRRSAYWALFAGAHGHTYGTNPVWQMYDEGREPQLHARRPWHEALNLPGGGQMQFARALVTSRPMLSRVPDQSLIAEGQGEDDDHIQAARGDGYAFLYLPTGKPVTVALGKISGRKIKAWWYDPRTGKARSARTFVNTGTRRFVPPGKPGRGNDWVLVLDDAGKRFPQPGRGMN